MNNIAIKEDDEFILLDWEQSDLTHLSVDLFDTALDMCGFYTIQTDLNLFKSVV